MSGHRIPTKEQLRLYGSEHPEARRYMELAEAQRKQLRKIQADKNKAAKKRKATEPKKTELTVTDHLIPRQIAQVERVLQAPGGRSRTRADYNRMLIVTLIETGLRVSELCDLRLENLPSFHGQQIIQVIKGKGKKNRTIGLSDDFAVVLAGYVGRYHIRGPKENYVFPSEAGGRVTRQAVLARVKRIGIKAGLWVWRDPKTGELKTELSPHKFRHTSGCCILNGSGKLSLVREQLGHASLSMSTLYAKNETEQRQRDLNKTSKYAWSEIRK